MDKLAISDKTLKRLIQKGQLEAVYLTGRTIRFRVGAVEEFLRARTRGAASANKA